jgi:hypothetical protein
LKNPEAHKPYELVHSLGEDELVGIMERTSLSGDRRLSKINADLLVEFGVANPELRRPDLLRDQRKRILRLGAFLEFQDLDDDEERKLVRETFEQAAAVVAAEAAKVKN